MSLFLVIPRYFSSAESKLVNPAFAFRSFFLTISGFSVCKEKRFEPVCARMRIVIWTFTVRFWWTTQNNDISRIISAVRWKLLQLNGKLASNRESLRKQAYSNILKISLSNEKFQIKNSVIFHISAQNIDCGYSLEPPHRGGSSEYRQFMFLSKNKENNVYPCKHISCKPQFYYIKVGFKGVKLI